MSTGGLQRPGATVGAVDAVDAEPAFVPPGGGFARVQADRAAIGESLQRRATVLRKPIGEGLTSMATVSLAEGVNSKPPAGLSNAQMAAVMQWGNGPGGAAVSRARIGTLTKAELVAGGVTLAIAQGWATFYRDVARANPAGQADGTGNPNAEARAELMERAVALLST